MILIIIFSLILIIEFLYYAFYINSNQKNSIEYYRDIPSNENPALVGLMVKGNVDGNDIVATILDLWEKGYISIEYRMINDSQKCIIRDSGKDRFLSLKDYENYLLDEIFKENNEVILEDFVNSPKFEIIFKNIGNMINKRIDIKSTHKISYKKLFNKVNFLTNYFVLGFSLLFSIIYMLINDFLISLAISCTINLIMFVIIKSLLVKNENGIESLLFGMTFALSIVYLGIIIILYLLSGYEYQINTYLLITNIIASLIFIICLIIGDYNKKIAMTTLDYIIAIYSILSICFGNLIGVCIGIIYYSHRLYLKSPKHVYLYNDEIEKWIALKKFLNDFSYIDQRELMEIKIWDKYLIYGISMGVNKKIVLEYAKMANIKLINNSILDKCYSENVMY
jgi:hypothetical protein